MFGIVEQNKGFIEVDSEPELGTVFTIYWPACNQPVNDAQTTGTPPDYRGEGQRILVVEDELEIRQYCKEVLTRHNYQVTLASSAEEAMALVLTENARTY